MPRSRARSFCVSTGGAAFAVVLYANGALAEQDNDSRRAAAQIRLERGIALLREESFDAACDELSASRNLWPTPAATRNAALCLRQVKRFDEALDLVEELLSESDALSSEDRAFAARERSALEALVGTLELRDLPEGARVAVDGRDRAAHPGGRLRVSVGAHMVRIFEPGFAFFERRVEVSGGKDAVVLVVLRRLERPGRLRVADRGGGSPLVLVDGVVVGSAPWLGPLEAGAHWVALRGQGDAATPPEVVRVRGGEASALVLTLGVESGRLRVEPSPVDAEVTLDDVPLGRGPFEGRVLVGKHRVEVARPGSISQSRAILIDARGPTVVRVRLEPDPSSPVWEASPSSRFLFEGRVGGVFGAGLGGDVGGCTGCDPGLVYGGATRASLGYERASGFGVTADVGYLWLHQSVSNRSSLLAPLPAFAVPVERGVLDHGLTARGATFGAGVFFQRGTTRVRWSARLGAGLWLGSVTDERSGIFTTSVSRRPDGTIGAPAAYPVGTIAQTSDARYLFAAPEVRLGVPLSKHLHVSAGLEAMFAFAVTQPRWNSPASRVETGTCGNDPSNECVTDGTAVFEESKLMSETLFFVVPGVAIVYEL